MDNRRKQLGEFVRRERVRLEMRSQPALAEAASISARKVSDVERGEFAGPKTYDAIASALGWPGGSIQRYLAGGARPESAATAGPGVPGLLLDWTSEEIARVRAMSPEAAIEEGGVVRKVSGAERQLEYLHDIYLIRRAPVPERVNEPAGGDAAP